MSQEQIDNVFFEASMRFAKGKQRNLVLKVLAFLSVGIVKGKLLSDKQLDEVIKLAAEAPTLDADEVERRAAKIDPVLS